MRGGRQASSRGESDVWKGLAAGLIGGLVAAWTMNRFQDVWRKLSERNGQSAGTQDAQAGEGQASGQGEQQAQADNAEQEDATVKAAAISEGIFEHKLTKSEKKIAGPAVHYAFGTVVGACMARAPNSCRR